MQSPLSPDTSPRSGSPSKRDRFQQQQPPSLSATHNSVLSGSGNNNTTNSKSSATLHQTMTSVVDKGVPATSSVRFPSKAQFRVADMFSEIPEVLEFESWWTEVSNGKTTPAANLTSQSRARSAFTTIGAAGTASSHSNRGGARGGAPATGSTATSSGAAATNPTSAAIAKSAAVKVGMMGPSGANIISLGSTRRFMSITYYPQSQQFHILTDDGKVPLVIAVRDRYDEPLQPWHLHVGAVIDVLGRPTTLMAASGATLHWLNTNAKRLWEMKMALERRVNQFRGRPRVDLDSGVFRPLWEPNPGLGGKIPLYKLANIIASLDVELQGYRQ